MAEFYNVIYNFIYSDLGVFLLRCLCSVIFALIIGLERELTGHKGSIKVNILIALGSCIFCSFEVLAGLQDARISANITTGVGFLCAGFIMKTGTYVNGLSTAATLWCSAAMGLLTSRGYIIEALCITILLFSLNLIVSKFFKNIKPLKGFDDSQDDVTYKYNIVCLKKNAQDVRKVFINTFANANGVNLDSVVTKGITEDKFRVVAIVKMDSQDAVSADNIIDEINNINGVLSAGWEQENID